MKKRVFLLVVCSFIMFCICACSDMPPANKDDTSAPSSFSTPSPTQTPANTPSDFSDTSVFETPSLEEKDQALFREGVKKGYGIVPSYVEQSEDYTIINAKVYMPKNKERNYLYTDYVDFNLKLPGKWIIGDLINDDDFDKPWLFRENESDRYKQSYYEIIVIEPKFIFVDEDFDISKEYIFDPNTVNEEEIKIFYDEIYIQPNGHEGHATYYIVNIEEDNEMQFHYISLVMSNLVAYIEFVSSYNDNPEYYQDLMREISSSIVVNEVVKDEYVVYSREEDNA